MKTRAWTQYTVSDQKLDGGEGLETKLCTSIICIHIDILNITIFLPPEVLCGSPVQKLFAVYFDRIAFKAPYR